MTAGGLFTTGKQGTLVFKLPEFSNSKDITWSMDMDNGKLEELGYDMIIGRDSLFSLGMIIDFKYSVIRWGENDIPMNRTKLAKNDRKELNEIFQLATESKAAKEATNRVTQILDAHYEKANIVETISKNCSHLSNNKQQQIINLLNKYEELFDGTLGDMNTSPVHLEVKEGAKPKHHKPFPVPKIHEMTLKKELKRLCKLGVLKNVVILRGPHPPLLFIRKMEQLGLSLISVI